MLLNVFVWEPGRPALVEVDLVEIEDCSDSWLRKEDSVELVLGSPTWPVMAAVPADTVYKMKAKPRPSGGGRKRDSF